MPGADAAPDAASAGEFAIELEGLAKTEQSYIENTAILRTRLYDSVGNGVEIIDFAPRFRTRGRQFRPMTMVRRVRPLCGTPQSWASLLIWQLPVTIQE